MPLFYPRAQVPAEDLPARRGRESAYPGPVPRYEYRCRECTEVFEVSRPMAESALPASCPSGHADAVRLLSTVALTGSGAAGWMPAPAAGGCCGGACGCG